MTEGPCLGHGIALRGPAGGVVLKRPLLVLCNVSREVPGRLAMGERDAESPAVVKIAAACPQERRAPSVGGGLLLPDCRAGSGVVSTVPKGLKKLPGPFRLFGRAHPSPSGSNVLVR